MPADVEFPIALGRDGLNLRDQPLEVPISELVDGVNWMIDENGALVKRLGYQSWGDSDAIGAGVLEQATFNPSSGAVAALFYCDDGNVYSSPGDGTFTSIASGLSTSARPTFAMLADKIYWSNGVDAIQQWDGTTLTPVTDGDAPKPKYLAVWRNRLWGAGDPAHPHRVAWSDIAAPTSWNSLNIVDIYSPHGDEITGLAAAPNIGAAFDGSDGVLVYMNRSTHRVFDDTDNTVGASGLGGANVLVDAGVGTSSHRSIAALNGRIYSVNPNGVYSTDGHDTQRLESSRLGPFFHNGVNPGGLEDAIGIAWDGKYWLGCAGAGSAVNNLLLEVYASRPRAPDGGLPVMAHDIAASAWSIFPDPTGDQLVFSDANVTEAGRVRQYGLGGGDTTGQATTQSIVATARSGVSTFDTIRPKRARRVEIIGRSGPGGVVVGMAADLERSIGEARNFILNAPGSPKWNQVKWNQFQWGPKGGVAPPASNWYTRRGRFFQVTLQESSSVVSTTAALLGTPSAIQGGAAIYGMVIRMTPLDSE